MSEVSVKARGGVVVVELTVGGRTISAALSDADAQQVVWQVQAARAEAACQREKRQQAGIARPAIEEK